MALLYLFQGFVDVDALYRMGNAQADWCLPLLSRWSTADLVELLHRAADIGLLAPAFGLPSGFYTIHPALPWFFKTMFDQYYPKDSQKKGEKHKNHPSSSVSRKSATLAFVAALAQLGNYYSDKYEAGHREVLAILEREEANLHYAYELAHQSDWFEYITGTMQGLRVLYKHMGRRADWRRLVEEIVPDFVIPATDGPRPGRERKWILITQYRVHLAREARDWTKAERLQRLSVNWDRQRAADILKKVKKPNLFSAITSTKPDPLKSSERKIIQSLAISLGELGHILREQGKAECIDLYEEAAHLHQLVNDRTGESMIAFNLGHAYKQLPARRNLVQAERWYQRSLDLSDEEYQYHDRAQCALQLGIVAYERFNEARLAGQPRKKLLECLNVALAYCQQALDLLPANAVRDLAVTHNQLGLIYKSAGDTDHALSHYQQAIRYAEAADDLYLAGLFRFNVAIALHLANRLVDARDYIKAALRNYEQLGSATVVEKVKQARKLLADIERDLRK